MTSKRTVLFDGDSAYLLEGFRDTRNHIRGRVVNGGWTMYIVKDNEFSWQVYTACNREQCVAGNHIRNIDPSDVSLVEVPETVFGDYNVVINWARTRKEDPCES